MVDSGDEKEAERIALRTPSIPAVVSYDEPLIPPRDFVAANADLAQLGALADLEKISVLSYNVLSQMGARRLQRSDKGYVGTALLSTLRRRERLRRYGFTTVMIGSEKLLTGWLDDREILSYDADVLCLQEIDDYDDYWSNELTANGYDSVFAMHPVKRVRVDTAAIDHGLVIAFKRELFQLFRTQEIDLNEVVPMISDANLAAKCEQDNIALCVQLQPWESSRMPSAVCVVTTQLASGDGLAMDHVRVLQAEYLCREIAQLNAIANLPILLAGKRFSQNFAF